MKTIMVIGVGPMPAAEQQRVHATGLRLQWAIDSLKQAGIENIIVGEMLFSGSDSRKFSPRKDLYAHRLLSASREEAVSTIDHWCKLNPIDGIVALTDIGAYAVAASEYEGPLFVDYFGHPMAERQQQASAHQSDESLHEQWLNVLPVLLRADKFGACSQAQRHALIGELGAAGRLNAATCGYELVEILPTALSFDTPHQVHHPAILQQWGVPEGAKVILSTGGFNTWLDEETLYNGVNAALSQEPSFHFVATGGPIPGHVEVVFERFRERVNNSEHYARFHFPGWVRHEELLDAMATADVAVNCDLPTLEGELGSRNRLLGWAWQGLRIASTITGGPAKKLEEMGLLRSFAFGDWEHLARLLCEEAYAGSREDIDGVQKHLREVYDLNRLYEPLTKWAKDPQRAPDRREGVVDNPLAKLQQDFLKFIRQQRAEHSIRRRARELGERLSGSRMISFTASMNPDTKALIEELKDL